MQVEQQQGPDREKTTAIAHRAFLPFASITWITKKSRIQCDYRFEAPHAASLAINGVSCGSCESLTPPPPIKNPRHECGAAGAKLVTSFLSNPRTHTRTPHTHTNKQTCLVSLPLSLCLFGRVCERLTRTHHTRTYLWGPRPSAHPLALPSVRGWGGGGSP